MYRKLFWVVVVLLGFVGCIDPVDFKYKGQTEHLVVEGKFTNQPNLNYVRLSMSRPFESVAYVFVDDATVYITSDGEERINFLNDKSGYYYPENNAGGSEGHTYTLHVTTGEGNVYESEPTEILSAVSIDSVRYAQEEAQSQIEGQRFAEIMPGYRFFIDYTDPALEDNYYRWSYQVEFEVDTQPQDYLERGCVSCPRPAPKSCCAQCWIQRSEDKIIVGTDRLTDGQQVIRQPLFFLPYEMYMNIRMKLTIQQHNLSQQAYDFFKSMEQQKETTGEIFDPPPTEVKGNMRNINNEQEQVIGLFEVSAVATKQIVVSKTMIPYEIPKFIYIDDCREIKNSTTIMPPDW